jgi:hypothetical protein
MEATNPSLQSLSALIGEWTTEATHPAFPSTVVLGRSTFEWLEGERFLIARARSDHPDFPDSISIIGDAGGLRMHYFDSRGVARIYEMTLDGGVWTFSRTAPDFSPRAARRPRSRPCADDEHTDRFVGVVLQLVGVASTYRTRDDLASLRPGPRVERQAQAGQRYQAGGTVHAYEPSAADGSSCLRRTGDADGDNLRPVDAIDKSEAR